MASADVSAAGRRSLAVLAWAAAPVLLLAVVVQVRGVGIDLLMIALVGLVLLALERLLGSLLSDWIGPFAAGMIFAALVVGLSWFFLSSATGRSRTERFFAEAERRGYRTVWYRNPKATDSAGIADAARERERQKKEEEERAAASLPVRTSGAAPAAPSAPAPPAPARPGPAGREQESRFRRAVRSFFNRSTSNKQATSLSLGASPAQTAVSQRVVLRAGVRAGGEPVTYGTVEFLVNGRGAGRVNIDSQGVASTTYIPRFAGSYEVRARFSGTAELESSVSTTTFTAR